MNGESRSLGKWKEWEPVQGGGPLVPAIAEDAQMELRLCLVGGQEVSS